MKQQPIILLTLMASMAVACSGTDSSDNEIFEGWTPGTNPPSMTDNSSSSMDAGELTTFDIAIDSTSMTESETIDSNDEDYVENNSFDNTIYISYNGSSATVTGDANGLVSVNGAQVTATPTKKAVYVLSGNTSDGFFRINDDEKAKKSEIILQNVSINNASGPAINIQSGKRTYIVSADGTSNSLSDGTNYASSTEDQKGTLFSEGELLFSGKGRLNIQAHVKNGIASDDYIMVRPNTNIYVKSTNGNGIKGKDALMIRGGMVNIETSAAASKGISTDGYYQQDGGRVTIINSGNAEYDSDEKDMSGASGLKADSIITINGGQLFCKSTGKGGKGISTDQVFTMNKGTVKVITTGTTYAYNSSLDSKSKGIKADGNIDVNGGTIWVRATGDSGSEGIESKAALTINDGEVKSYSYDDAINSAKDLTIKGGSVFACGLHNDGLDANGNVNIQGGYTIAYGASQPEQGIDANTEENYKLYITGGTVIGIGGGATTPTTTTGSQPVLIYGGTVSNGSTLSIKDSNNTDILSFVMGREYNSATFLISAPGMTSNSSYTLYNGSTSLSSFTATVPYSTIGNASTGFGGGPGGIGGGPGGMGGGPRW